VTALPIAERLLTAPEAVEEWARTHGRVHFTERNLHHWRRQGVSVGNGERIRLRARKLGRLYYFTLCDIDEFARTVAEADGSPARSSGQLATSGAAPQRVKARGRMTKGRCAAAERFLDEELG
jgi:hypothetical protein